MLAFMVVKTPVSLVGTAVYAEPQISTASATSEADITKNINQTLQRPEILTTEEKAAAQTSFSGLPTIRINMPYAPKPVN